MISNVLKIGPAPDFFMKQGSLSVYHAAVISLISSRRIIRKFNLSHLSFLNLTKEISQKLVGFGWTHIVSINWRSGELMSLDFETSQGAIVVQYRMPPQVPDNIKFLLNREMRNGIESSLVMSSPSSWP